MTRYGYVINLRKSSPGAVMAGLSVVAAAALYQTDLDRPKEASHQSVQVIERVLYVPMDLPLADEDLPPIGSHAFETRMRKLGIRTEDVRMFAKMMENDQTGQP